jgi:methyl-accepting chemotaxis protein
VLESGAQKREQKKGKRIGMKNRRRQFIVDKKLQYRLLIYNGIYSLVIILAIGTGLVLPLVLELSDPNLSVAQHGDVVNKILYLHSRLSPILLIVLLLLLAHSVVISHRIAGPLYRFRATFNQVAQGDLSRMTRIRKGDFLLNEQAKIEEMIEALRSRLHHIKNEHAVMERSLQALVECPLGGPHEDLAAIIAQLKECNSRLRKELEYFRFSDTDMFDLGKGSAIQPRPVRGQIPT